jgi:hypothetical protein
MREYMFKPGDRVKSGTSGLSGVVTAVGRDRLPFIDEDGDEISGWIDLCLLVAHGPGDGGGGR